MQDSVFTSKLRCRWDQFRQTFLHADSLDAFIDNIAAITADARMRDETRWNILGDQLFSQPTPIPTTFTEEYNLLKTFLRDRAIWLDANIPGNCTVGMDERTAPTISVYPNPVTNQLVVERENNRNVLMQIVSADGKLVYSKQLVSTRESIDVSGWESGLYAVIMDTSIVRFLKL